MNAAASGSSSSEQAPNVPNLPGTETPPPSAGSPASYVPPRAGIPAWQLAAREKAQQSAKAEEQGAQAS
jgi:hypothetical protein